MRKTITSLFMLLLMAASVHATSIEMIDGLRYFINTGAKEASLLPLTDGHYKGDIVVPPSVSLGGEAYPVVAFHDKCFYGCDSLTSISIPSTVTTLGKSCFCVCKMLTSITIPNSVTSLGENCFAYSGLTSITVPPSIEVLPDNCFESCQHLSTITIPSSVTSLGNACFRGCYDLSAITIPSSVTSLGGSCFGRCISLTSFTIPSSVTSLGMSCFWGCEKLSSVTIPLSITSLPAKSFQYCYSLTAITIPSSVTSLGQQCFEGCKSLAAIVIPSSVTSLGYECFYDCESLTDVSLPNSISVIPTYCFRNCTSLTTIKLPASVKTMGSTENGNHVGGCFEGCSKLSSIYCLAETPPSFESMGFGGSYSSSFTNMEAFLYVPSQSLDEYKSAPGWEDFFAILPIDSTGSDEQKFCETPVVTFSGGELHFESPTEGAVYHYTLTNKDVKDNGYSEGTVALEAAYHITVYATATGYQASNKATATLYWLQGSLDDPTNINITKKRGIAVSSSNGMLTLSGLDNGEEVSFYTTDGKMIGKAFASNGMATYSISNAHVVIARIGTTGIKIAL